MSEDDKSEKQKEKQCKTYLCSLLLHCKNKKINPHLNDFFFQFEKDLNVFVHDALNRQEAIY